MAVLEKRIFLGNLPSKVTQSDVKKKLSRFGNVSSVELKQRTDSDGTVLSTFAFVDIAVNASDLANCFQFFENEQWHENKVKVQLAKESFLERLKRERKDVTSPGPVDMKRCAGEISHGKTSNSSSKFGSDNLEQVSWSSKDKRPRTSIEGVKSLVKRLSSGGKNLTVDGDEYIVKNRTVTYSIENLSAHGLPKFGGSKLIVGEEICGVKVNDCGGKSPKGKNTNFKKEKTTSPHSVNDVKEPKSSKIKSPGVEDVCNGPPEDSPKRKKNLPMFCGTANLISPENPVKKVDSQSNSEGNVFVVPGSNEALLSRRKSMRQDSADGHNIQGKTIDKNICAQPKSEGKSKKISSLNSVPLSPSKAKPTCSSQGRNIAKPKTDIISERKRLNALEEKKKAFDLQKEAVKQALSSVDSKNRSNKKIIFDDDDEDVPSESLGKEKISIIQSENSKPKLFQDESDEEDIKNLESAEFKIKPQFEGRQGQKLLEIQSRYGHDSRFNLDERFLESDEEQSTKEEIPGEEDLNVEKDHQLNILKEMLGVDVTSRKPKRVDKSKDSFQMVRFDPTNPQHSKYLVKEEDLKRRAEEEGEEKKGKKLLAQDDSGKVLSKKIKKEEGVEDEPVPVVMERFYKVSDKLKESLRKRAGPEEEGAKQNSSSGGFSLLQKFGSPCPENEQEETEYSTKEITRKRNEWEKNPFRYDSSEEEDDDVRSTKPSDTKPKKSVELSTEKPVQANTGAAETFYFLENDPRLQEGLSFFGVKKTFAEMQEGFHERRTDLKMIIKAKVRNNKRRKRPLKKKLGGARRHKKKMASFGVKR